MNKKLGISVLSASFWVGKHVKCKCGKKSTFTESDSLIFHNGQAPDGRDASNIFICCQSCGGEVLMCHFVDGGMKASDFELDVMCLEYASESPQKFA